MLSISHSHNFVTYYIMLGIREKQKSRPDSPRRQKSDETFTLHEQKSQAEADTSSSEETQKRIAELQDFIAGQETDITEFDEALVKKLIEKITVFADHFTVEFKSGITIDIEA